MDNQHIKNLVVNLPKEENLGSIDLVLESGAANGSYQIGCLLYLKELENQKKVKIDRISGSSIGAISGFYYFTNMLDKYNCPKNFDLLNIDVENHELDVLRGLDFKIYKPKIITIEIHTKKTKDIFKSPTYKYLEKENYELISQYYQTSFFKIKNF